MRDLCAVLAVVGILGGGCTGEAGWHGSLAGKADSDGLLFNDLLFNEYVWRAIETIGPATNKHVGDGVTRRISYGGELIAQPAAAGICHCVGSTFQVFMAAFERWDQDTHGDGSLEGMTVAQVKDLKRLWFVPHGYDPASMPQGAGSTEALGAYGLGQRIHSPDRARRGDFLNIWRRSSSGGAGSGHAVIFDSWERDASGRIAAVNYFGCNRAGTGIHSERVGDEVGDVMLDYALLGRGRLPGTPGGEVSPAVQPRPPAADVGPPSVRIVSPAPGPVASNPVTVEVAVEDAGGVARVNLLLDGQIVGQRVAAPFVFSVTLPVGQSTIAARAYDRSGNSAEAVVEVSAETPPAVPSPVPPPANGDPPVDADPPATTDTVPPLVQIVSPAAGAQTGKQVTVQVQASDDVGVVSVELRVGDRLVEIRTSAPYVFEVELPEGRRSQLTAIARDAAGNSAQHSIEVDVAAAAVPEQPPVDTTAPVVTITAPASGASVPARCVVSARVEDDGGVHRVDLKVDGVYRASVTQAPYAFEVDLAGAPGSQLTLTVEAVDRVGHRGQASVTVTLASPGGPASPTTQPQTQPGPATGPAPAPSAPSWPAQQPGASNYPSAIASGAGSGSGGCAVIAPGGPIADPSWLLVLLLAAMCRRVPSRRP